MTIYADCIRCGRCDNEMILSKASSGTVIHDNSILTQHQAIAGFANIQLSKTIAINFIQKGSSITALHINFAKCCYITDTNRSTSCYNLTINRLSPMSLTILWKPLCSVPHAYLDKYRTLFFRPFMARRLTYWPKIHITRPSGKYPDSRWAIGGPVNCRASIRDRLASGMRHNRETQDIRCFTLISCHAKCSVAF